MHWNALGRLDPEDEKEYDSDEFQGLSYAMNKRLEMHDNILICQEALGKMFPGLRKQLIRTYREIKQAIKSDVKKQLNYQACIENVQFSYTDDRLQDLDSADSSLAGTPASSSGPPLAAEPASGKRSEPTAEDSSDDDETKPGYLDRFWKEMDIHRVNNPLTTVAEAEKAAKQTLLADRID